MFEFAYSTPRKIFSRAVLTASLLMAGVSAASALPAFTFSPSGVGLTGVNITADNIILSDFSTIMLTPNAGGASFTDNGVLAVVGFQLAGSPITTAGLNSTYGLYFEFTGTGQQTTATLQSSTTGVFTSLNYQLYGYTVTGPVTYQPSATTPTGVSSPILLATGSLISGGVGATTIPGVAVVPNANTLLAITPSATAFFAAPSPFYNADFAAFTNNPSQIMPIDGGFEITQGGGSANFLNVPEPISLSLLAFGAGATLLARRRRATAAN